MTRTATYALMTVSLIATLVACPSLADAKSKSNSGGHSSGNHARNLNHASRDKMVQQARGGQLRNNSHQNKIHVTANFQPSGNRFKVQGNNKLGNQFKNDGYARFDNTSRQFDNRRQGNGTNWKAFHGNGHAGSNCNFWSGHGHNGHSRHANWHCGHAGHGQWCHSHYGRSHCQCGYRRCVQYPYWATSYPWFINCGWR